MRVDLALECSQFAGIHGLSLAWITVVANSNGLGVDSVGSETSILAETRRRQNGLMCWEGTYRSPDHLRHLTYGGTLCRPVDTVSV
jgi:hypothetical protein